MNQEERDNLNKSGRSILQWNLNGLKRHYNELRQIISKYNVYALALQETHTREDFRIPHFQSYYCHDTGHARGTWGGVAIAVHDEYSHHCIPLKTIYPLSPFKYIFRSP